MSKDDDRLSRAEMRALLRSYTHVAYETLLSFVRDPKLPMRVRNSAMKTLVAHGLVKPAVPTNDPAKLQ